MKKSNRSKPGIARFRALVNRALHELGMAEDVARAEGLDPAVVTPVEASRKNLRVSLRVLKLAEVAEGGEGE